MSDDETTFIETLEKKKQLLNSKKNK